MKALIIFLMLISSAWADSDNPCNTNLTLGNATIQVQNNIQVIAQSYSISRSDPSNGRCSSYRLYFSKGIANSYQRQAANSSGARADYNLHQNIQMVGTLKDVNDANSSTEYIQGSTPNENVSYNGTFYISVPGLSSQGSLANGTYTDNIQIRVYSEKNNGDLLLEEVQPFSVNLIVSVNMEISLVDEGGIHNASSTAKILDFGNLATNQELGCDITVSSNTAYQVRLSSLNNGNLVRGSSTVAYQVRVNNTPYAMTSSASSPVTVATGVPTGTNPARYNVKVKITGTTTDNVAGDYADTITITAITN